MICRTLGIGRATAYRDLKGRPRRYHRREDPVVVGQLREVLRERGSYGHRRARVLVNRAFGTSYGRERVRRLMRLYGMAVPVRGRRRSGRAHRGVIQREESNQRWSSDVMEIPCWNSEVVHLAFALDCCDREVIAYVATAYSTSGVEIRRLMRQAVFARFGNEKPREPLQWLSDNESIYTALETVIEAENLGLVPITTPAASPESNGMSEAFVNTLRRDYIEGGDRASAAQVLEQIPGWIEDYNTFAPHSSLGMKPPAEYRREQRST
jgi:transposase InsO family protein